MMRSRSLYPEQVILLAAVIVPLSLSEGVWWYAGLAGLAAVIGWWRTRRDRKPLLGPRASRAFVLAAFSLLLCEYLWLFTVPVMALAHFMILVCASKFLQERSLRDDAQFAVLCLLLLVVAAIVSGSVIFLPVLGIYLSLGLDLLARFNLSLERAHVHKASLAVCPTTGDGPPDAPSVRGINRPMLLMSLTSVTVGVLVFILFPRMGAGMFGRADGRGTGHAATGFSTAINFNAIGPTTESDRQIMRVKVEASRGAPPGPEEALYLRGGVFDYYGIRGPGGHRREWRRYERMQARIFDVRHLEDEDEFSLLPGYDGMTSDRILIQRYTIEPGAIDEPVLFCLAPAVAMGRISSDEVDTVAEFPEDQSLRTGRPIRKVLRYTVKSADGLTPAVQRAMAADRAKNGFPEPQAHPPNPPLPEEARIRELMEPFLKRAGSLDVPANRRKFAELLQDWLSSSEFAYTLSPPAPPRGQDPVCEFLLRTRKGHCQYFASAMVIMCQLADVPVHLVSGFHCDTYNEMGGFWSVRSKHAHAWVEVYIPGEGWVRFDPTPSAGATHAAAGGWLRTLRSCGDYLEFHWANLVLAYDAEARRDLLQRFGAWILRPMRNEATPVGMAAAFVYELFAWRMAMTWNDRLLYWGFALLVVALAVLSGYVIVVLSWRGGNRLTQYVLSKRAGAGRADDAVFYRRLCRRLSALGFRRRPEQTPVEFVADVVARCPMLGPSADVVNAYYEVIYGKRSLSPGRRQAFEEFLAKLNGIDKTTLQAPQ